MNKVRFILRVCWHTLLEWADAFSGALSFFIAGMVYFKVFNESYVKSAYIAALFSAVWANIKLRRLEDRHRPKLVLDFIHNGAGCVEDGNDGQPFKLLRLAVSNLGIDAVEECQGRILSVEHNGLYTFKYKTAVLTFAPSEDADTASKTIRQGITEFLDILDVNAQGVRIIRTRNEYWPPHFPAVGLVFPEPGNYILTISVFGKGMPTVQRKFTLILTGNYLEATMQPL